MLFPVELISALGVFLGVRHVTVCDDVLTRGFYSQELSLLSKSFYVNVAAPTDTFLAKDGMALIFCPSFHQVANVEVNKLDKHLHWLTSFPGGSDLESLPLRLDSNFYTYVVSDNYYFLLTEWYKAHGGDLMSTHLGSWSPEHGLRVSVPFKWNRRTDLGGAVLVNGVLKGFWPPICIVTTTSTGMIETSGLLSDVLDNLMGQLNFTVEHVFTEDGEYGQLSSSGNWTGIIRDLQDGNIDMSMSGLTITSDRSAVAGFTLGVLRDVVVIVMRDPGFFGQRNKLNFWAYLNVFPLTVWILILIFLVGTAIHFHILTRFSRPKDDTMTFQAGMALSYLTLLQLSLDSSHEQSLEQTPQRTAYFPVAIGFMFLFVCYNGDLTSFLTATSAPYKPKNFEV